MTIYTLQEKLRTLPESCFDELFNFMEYLEFKSSKEKNSPDIAKKETLADRIVYFSSIDEFISAMSKQQQS